MPAPLIRLGDRTTGGCTVINVKQQLKTVDGIFVATIGDLCACPKLRLCTIVEGSQLSFVNDIGVAYAGCKTSCGATLLASTTLAKVATNAELAGGGGYFSSYEAPAQYSSYADSTSKAASKPKTQVTAIQLDSPLDDGSANNGSGTSLKKGLLLDKHYKLSVASFSNGEPDSDRAIKWAVSYQSPATSQNKKIDVQLEEHGSHIELRLKDYPDMCGCEITIKAYIDDIATAATIKQSVHNRFYLFDAQKITQQVADRMAEPWRIAQGQTSLCGMAAYIML